MVLARPLGFKMPFKVLVHYYLIGMFFNLFAPSTVGGDISRVYYLSRDDANHSQKTMASSTMPAAVSAFIDRAIRMVGVVWLGAGGPFFFPRYVCSPAVPALV